MPWSEFQGTSPRASERSWTAAASRRIGTSRSPGCDRGLGDCAVCAAGLLGMLDFPSSRSDRSLTRRSASAPTDRSTVEFGHGLSPAVGRHHMGTQLSRTVLAGLVALGLPVAAARAADGDLDPTFGNGGKVVTNFNLPASSALAVAIQTDGKIVAAGFSFDEQANIDFAVARYDTEGTLDPAFGSDGGRRPTSSASSISPTPWPYSPTGRSFSPVPLCWVWCTTSRLSGTTRTGASTRPSTETVRSPAISGRRRQRLWSRRPAGRKNSRGRGEQ